MKTKSYLDLAAFRKANGINQAELADILGVSRSFISLIETGANKLPHDKFVLLNRVACDREWSTDELHPHLTRLKQLDKALVGRGVRRGKYPLDFSASTYLSFSQGRKGIDEELADAIVNDPKYTSRYININKEWLLTGKGEMFLPETVEQLSKKLAELMERFVQIEERLDNLEKHIRK